MPDIKRVVALGFFDGVHLGHAELLKTAALRAKELNAVASVLSFDVHPDTVVLNKEVPLINSAADREYFISNNFGINDLHYIHFDKQMMQTPWRDFIDNAVREYNIVSVVVGHDFCFGNKGEGNAALLKAYCAENAIGFDVIDAVEVEGKTVSSTYIRELIADGDVKSAALYLGHPHFISGKVGSGYQLGTKMGTPTINLYFDENVLVPRHGVYSSIVRLSDCRAFPAVTNIGVRPTVSDSSAVSVETYLIGFDENLYDEFVCVELHAFLRDEKKFDNVNELARQIRTDAENALLSLR